MDAYILIGVDEVTGGRKNAVGIKAHLDDASIRQFANGKTNRPVTFSYQAFPFEGVQLGIIQLPLQDRPIYLTKDFGKLRQPEVYIRRGSSTDIADPDEVAKMGGQKAREIFGELPMQLKSDPVVVALRHEREQGNVVIVDQVIHRFSHHRSKCTVIYVDDLYAVFRREDGQEISGAWVK